MAVFKCKMCGGTIEFEQGATVGVCDSCGTKQTLPRLDDDRRANLYDRANHFRRNNEFDKAAAIYEQILTEDTTDAEAYWSLVLCQYGIEYVEDPATRKRVPTVNRAQFTSIFDDDNYKSALQYADGYQRALYEEEAAAINEIQKGILAISQKEEPFDVFICYKETDDNGRRTPDSVLANDLYHQLTQEGFKVFFSRITLEDKLGTAYEPYIFAALNTAKVMVVLGTKPEHFSAVWVKNEWSRFLGLVKKSSGKKVLIPAYRDMDPYDLPEEFSHLQAQDMSKLGFMQDLIRGVKKLVNAGEDKPATVKETVVVGTSNANVAPLLERAFLFLEDGKWQDANIYCEKVLDIDPKNAEAYLGKLFVDLHIKHIDDLAACCGDLSKNANVQKLLVFGNNELKKQLNEYEKICVYNYAEEKYKSEQYAEAYYAYKSLNNYQDACAKSEVSYQNYLQVVEKRKQQLDTLESEYRAAYNIWNGRKKKGKKYLLLSLPSISGGLIGALVLDGILDNLKLYKLADFPWILFGAGFILCVVFAFVGAGFAQSALNKKTSLSGLKQKMENSQRELLPPEPSSRASIIPPVGKKSEEQIAVHGVGVYTQAGIQATNNNAYSGTVQNPATAKAANPSDLTKLTVFGYTGTYSNHPIISIYFNNLLIGEVSQNEIKTFNVPAPGMVTFKYNRRSTTVAMTGEMAVQLGFDAMWGGLIAQKC